MKNYRRKYIRALTYFAAAVVCAAGVWHQSQIRIAAAQLETEKNQTRMFYQFGEAAQAVYALRQAGASTETIDAQVRAAGNCLVGLSISSDAKEILFTCLEPSSDAEWKEKLWQDMHALLQSGAFAENTNAEKSAALEKLCKQAKPSKETNAENKQMYKDFLSEEVRQSMAWIFEDNKNFSIAAGRNDTVYFYHSNRYLGVYAPFRFPYYYVFGCEIGEAILDREACLANAVVFLQRTLPTAMRGNGVPGEAESPPQQTRDGCYYFSLSYPAYPAEPITVGVRRDTGSVIFMDAEVLLAEKIATIHGIVIE